MTVSAAPLSLLLVDDEEGIRIVLAALLQDMGYAVRLASTGDEALAEFFASPPDIVITDIKMPGLDGIALLKKIKEHAPGTEVIMLTGHGDLELAVTSLREGAGDFLGKPVSDDALEVALDRAGARMNMRETLRRHTEDLEVLVEQRTRELLRAERLAAMGEAAASLSHAIKNIAGALEGTMYVLEKGLELNKREYFEQGWRMIRNDLGRLRGLAVGLLDLGRPLELVYFPTDPEQPVREVAELLRSRAAEAGVSLELRLPGRLEPVVMAAEAVHQCLLNLVLNAVEACADMARQPGGGPIPQVSIAVEEKGVGDSRPVIYSVMDNGPGLPETAALDADACFQSGKKSGSGIGLFATRGIVRAMGAELEFQPAGGRGTVAILRLNPASAGTSYEPQ